FTLEKRFDDLVAMTKTFERNGKPLIKDPFIRQQMANFYTRLRGSLLNYYRNLTHALKTGQPGPESSIDKLAVSELIKEIASFAVSNLGPRSVLWKEDEPIDTKRQDDFLFSFDQTFGGGTSYVQRNRIGERRLVLHK